MQQATTLDRIAGVDLGDRSSLVCVIDGVSGDVLERATIATTRAAFEQYFGRHERMRVALETGTHSPWASRTVADAGHEVITANARQLPIVYHTVNKSDVLDCEKLARLARLDPRLLAPVQHRGENAQRDLALIRSRSALVRVRTQLINQARGTVKAFGSRLPTSSSFAFHRVTRQYVPAALTVALGPVFGAIGSVNEQIRALDHAIDRLASDAYPAAALLTQVHGVGNLTALAFMLTIDDPTRFSTSRMVGPYLGLTPRREQTGEHERHTHISKAGDEHVRWLLVQSAHHILRQSSPDSDLKRKGRKLAKSGSKVAKRIAVIAVARKLAVLLHALWITGEVYEPLRNAPGRASRPATIGA